MQISRVMVNCHMTCQRETSRQMLVDHLPTRAFLAIFLRGDGIERPEKVVCCHAVILLRTLQPKAVLNPLGSSCDWSYSAKTFSE